ncbi:MAG: hypothetical protein KDA69_13550 [Planctomycetaceae bacterium]|nr:hypothetical protein [Planctomycetaceae bacterium]MCA9045346.1 hypothetical protein [Planctomycetaceae bacterium]
MEARVLLSGTVQSELVGDTLFLNGDDAGNEVRLRRFAVLDEATMEPTGTWMWEVKGLAETTVSGQTNFTDSIAHVVVDLGGGDDVLQVLDVTRSASPSLSSLTVETGWGNDEILLHRINVSGRTTLDTGSGNDDITLGASRVLDTYFGELFMTTGAGNDTIQGTSFQVHNKTWIYTGTGDDTVEFSIGVAPPTLDPPPLGTYTVAGYALGAASRFDDIQVITYGGVDRVTFNGVWTTGMAFVRSEYISVETAHLDWTSLTGDKVQVGNAMAPPHPDFAPYVYNVIATGNLTIHSDGMVDAESVRALRSFGITRGPNRQLDVTPQIHVGRNADNTDGYWRTGVDVVNYFSAMSTGDVFLEGIRAFWRVRTRGKNISIRDVENQGQVARHHPRQVYIEADERLDITHLTTDSLYVFMSAGDNVINFDGVSTSTRSWVIARDGNDEFHVLNSTFQTPLTAYGGPGSDTWYASGENIIWLDWEAGYPTIR